MLLLIVASQASAAPSVAVRRQHAEHTLHALQRRLDLAVQEYDHARAEQRSATHRAAMAAHALAVARRTPPLNVGLISALGSRAAALEAQQSDSWARIGRSMGLHERIVSLIARERAVLRSLPVPLRVSFLAQSRDARKAAATALAQLESSGRLRGSSPGVRAVRDALRQVGVPYVWGGESAAGFDCSGLMQWAYAQAGTAIPRVALAQKLAGRPVARADLKPGDLVFFEAGIGHVAMYIGGGLIVEAPHTGAVVWVAPLGDSWHTAEYQGAVQPW